MNVCDTKTLYDTEFEAFVACAKHRDKDMIPYRCPGTGHYHITHKNRENRRGAGFGWIKCPTCLDFYKAKKKHTCPLQA